MISTLLRSRSQSGQVSACLGDGLGTPAVPLGNVGARLLGALKQNPVPLMAPLPAHGTLDAPISTGSEDSGIGMTRRALL